MALRLSASLQLIFCMPFIMSQSGSFSRASHQIEIQGQRVAPDNLLVVSSIQEDFEEGLRLAYFEVLLVRWEQAVCKQEGLEEYQPS